MGHFGTSSDANDTSWDVLGKFSGEDGVFPSTQAQADALAAWLEADFPGENAFYWRAGDLRETLLGPVVFLLREKLTVPHHLLTRALSIARAARADKAYLDCWRKRDEREDALAEEIKLILKALKSTVSTH